MDRSKMTRFIILAWRAYVHVAIRLCALAIVADCSAQTVGRIEGQGSVTADGAASYVIPLWAPPGRAGLQPDLKLTYNSQDGAGGLRLGWNLTGFSRIIRCRRTVAKDGDAVEIRFADGNAGDRYCLDGQRLVIVDGSAGPLSVYGADATEYRTEFDVQSKNGELRGLKKQPTFS
jgi:virulence plasmid B protein